MALISKTSKDLARIMYEEIGNEQICLKILGRWKDIRGMPGNFRIILEDIEPFITKIAKKQEKDISTEPQVQEISTQ